MVTLTGNLGERQKQLNAHVHEVAKQLDNFEDVKNMKETSDIDKFIKIDLASKYMNMDYIVHVLRAGDSLHITRALKCSWIYNDEYSEIMNPKFLQENIFPYMSLKMRRKMLIIMSMYITNFERAANFIKCCMDIQLPKLALKFAVYTTDRVKLEFLKENSDLLEEIRSKTYLKDFIGTSFTLADKLLSLIHSESNKLKVLHNLRHLYALSDVTYLAMLERYVELTPFNNPKRLGSTITKHIIKNHKTRVFDNLTKYINFLHMKTIARCITPDDAKTVIFDLHPKSVEEFWSQDFYIHYGTILNKIPDRDRYQLIRSMFNYRYPHHAFEKSIQFYNGQGYKVMTEEERLNWILGQIESNQEIYGSVKNYILYKCLTFDNALEEITNLIKVTTEWEKRSNMMLVLLETVKNQCHIKTLLNYYHDNHSHEPGHAQEYFINRLLHEHKGYDFDTDCWTTLNKIFRKLRVYDLSYDNAFILNFRVTAVIYYILNENNLPEELIMFITNNMYLSELHMFTCKISLERQERIFQYLFNFYLGRIREFHPEQKVTYVIRKYLNYMLDLLSFYGRTSDDIPKEVMNFVRSDSGELGTHRLIHVATVTQIQMMQLLKVDANLAVKKLPLIKRTHETNDKFNVGQLLKKIKVYFPNDISQKYLEFYYNWLSKNLLSKSCTEAATYAIFLLGDEAFKVNFMTTNAPLYDRIKRNKIEAKMLCVQHAICATVFYSRPPVPLKNILMYVRGQYIRSCLPLITSYLVNLPLPLCIEFLEAILKTRSLAQKHGVRVAFACFTAENLRKLIVYIWKKNRNVSLRLVIYRTLYNKIVKEKEYAQTALFESLIAFTSDLNENDNDIFKILLSGGLPAHLVSDYMNAVWIAVNSLPNTNINIKRRSAVIEHLCTIFYSLRQDHVRPIIEDFIEDLFDVLHTKIGKIDDDIFYLYNKKWELTGKHITYVRNENDLYVKTELAQLITTECLEVFNVSDGVKYIGRDLFVRFLRYLQDESYSHPFVCYEYVNMILDKVIETLKSAFPIEQLYFLIWEIHMDIAVRKTITNVEIHCSNTVDLNEKITTVRNALLHYGEYIGNVIKNFVADDTYYRCLAPFILNEMCPQIEKIVRLIGDIDPKDVMIMTSLALIAFKTSETYMFALLLLPEDYAGFYVSDYNTVLNDIKHCDNMEVIALMFQKFVNSDYKPRDFLQF